MALLVLRDYVYNDLGVGVGGLRVRAYPITDVSTGALASTHVAEVSTASTTGRWEITLDTVTQSSPTGLYAIQVYNASTNQIRWRRGDLQLQVGFLTGANGALPFNDGAVTTAKIADNAVTDAKIGSRTVNQAISSFGDSGTITQLLSGIGKMILAITGGTDWKTAPATSLAAAYAHMIATNNPHSATASQVGAVQNYLNSTPRIGAGVDSQKGSGASGYIYVATDTKLIYRHDGTQWIKVASGSYNNLDDKPGSSAQSRDFGIVHVGSTFASATAVGDVISFNAGSGISLSLDANTKTVTISAAAGSGGSVPAHTHPGTDIQAGSPVPDSGKLQGIFGGRYPYFAPTDGFATPTGYNITSSLIKIAAGSQVITTNGSGIIGFQVSGVTMNGIVTWLCSNGDYDAYNGTFVPQQAPTSFPVANPTFQAHGDKTPYPTSGTAQRINYIIIYW